MLYFFLVEKSIKRSLSYLCMCLCVCEEKVLNLVYFMHAFFNELFVATLLVRGEIL